MADMSDREGCLWIIMTFLFFVFSFYEEVSEFFLGVLLLIVFAAICFFSTRMLKIMFKWIWVEKEDEKARYHEKVRRYLREREKADKK